MMDVCKIVDLHRARSDAEKHFARLARRRAKVVRRYERALAEYERVEEGLRCSAQFINAASRELWRREVTMDVGVEVSCEVHSAYGTREKLL